MGTSTDCWPVVCVCKYVLHGADQFLRLNFAEKLCGRFLCADDCAIFFADGNPFAQAGIRPEPRDDRRLRHYRQMQRATIAAKMQRAVLDDRGKLDQIQRPGKHAPRFLGQQHQQLFHFLQFAFRRCTGQGQFLIGEIFSKHTDEFPDFGQPQMKNPRRLN